MKKFTGKTDHSIGVTVSDRTTIDKELKPDCPFNKCDGSGIIYVGTCRTVAGCCGRPNRDGSCCGNAIPVQVEDCEAAHCECDSMTQANQPDKAIRGE